MIFFVTTWLASAIIAGVIVVLAKSKEAEKRSERTYK